MRHLHRRWGLDVTPLVLGRRLEKAKPRRTRFQRLPPISVDSNHVLAATVHYKAALRRAFRALAQSVATQVKHKLDQRQKLAKQDDDSGQDEGADWATATGIADSLDLSALTMVVDSASELGASVAGDTGRVALAQFGMNDNSDIVDQVDQRAADWSDDRAAELVGMRYNSDGELVPAARASMRIDEATRNMIRQTIFLGLQEGWRSHEIADSLQNDHAFSEDRAALIANSEIRRAHSQGALIGYEQAAANGVKVMKAWSTSGDNPCQDCQDNEDEGSIPLGQDFQSGDDAPPAHPNCRCVIVPVVLDAGWGGAAISALASRELTETETKSIAAAEDGRNMSFNTGEKNPYFTKQDIFTHAYPARDTLASWLHSDTGPLASLGPIRFFHSAPDDVANSAYNQPGPILFGIGVKKEARATEKVTYEYDGEWERLFDSYRTTVAVDSPEDAYTVAADLVRSGLAVRVKDTQHDPLEDTHWRDIKINIRMPNGLIGEIAIVTKKMLLAKNVGHAYYETSRTIEAKYTVDGVKKPKSEWAPEDYDKWKVAVDKQAELYDEAWRQSESIRQ